MTELIPNLLSLFLYWNFFLKCQMFVLSSRRVVLVTMSISLINQSTCASVLSKIWQDEKVQLSLVQVIRTQLPKLTKVEKRPLPQWFCTLLSTSSEMKSRRPLQRVIRGGIGIRTRNSVQPAALTRLQYSRCISNIWVSHRQTVNRTSGTVVAHSYRIPVTLKCSIRYLRVLL